MENKAPKKKYGRQGQKYPDAVIAQGLAIYDVEGTLDAVVKKTGATKDTVRKWVKERDKYEGNGSVTQVSTFAEIYTKQKDELLKTNLNLQHKALQQVEKRIGEANAYQAALIYGILHDKIARATGEGQPAGNTTNIMISNMGQEEATQLMSRVLERANSGKTDK